MLIALHVAIVYKLLWLTCTKTKVELSRAHTPFGD